MYMKQYEAGKWILDNFTVFHILPVFKDLLNHESALVHICQSTYNNCVSVPTIFDVMAQQFNEAEFWQHFSHVVTFPWIYGTFIQTKRNDELKWEFSGIYWMIIELNM